MKYFNRPFFALFAAALLLCSFARAQEPWSSVLSSSRAINWQNAGLPASFTDVGGSNVETTTNPWTPPTRTQSGSTINIMSGTCDATHDCTSTINSALSACTDGHYVLIGPGTFLVSGVILSYVHSCTLRGSGPNSTSLSGPTFYLGNNSGVGSCTLTSGSNFASGSTSVTCTGSAPSVNQLVTLTQCDTGFSGPPGCTAGTSADNGGLFICGGFTTCMSEPSGGTQYASQDQNLIVTAVSGSGPYTVTFAPALYMPNWSYAQGAFLTWSRGNGTGVGLEDMTINNGWVDFANTYASWIKGVRFVQAASSGPMTMSTTLNGLIADNYFFNDTDLDGSYGAGISGYIGSNDLILNNIMIGTVEPWEGFGGNVGNVFAYNMARDSFSLYTFNDTYDHHAYSSFDLFEGNQMGQFIEDDTWGTHGLNTYFRNYAPCSDIPYTTFGSGDSPRGFYDSNYQRFENALGNAFGLLGVCSTYQSTASQSIFQMGTDPLTVASLYRWGNVSVITQSTDTPADSGIRFVSGEVPNSTNMPSGTYPNAAAWQQTTPSTDNLPCSFFLTGSSTSCTPKYSGGTGLSWWKVCTAWNAFPTSCLTTQAQPFPVAGPDQSGGPYVNGHAYDVPAAIAWQYLPVDTTYQNSYTINGSSWSSGTETLTFASGSFPSGSVHIMGAFQLSGINSACTSGATFGGNGEILMTGSSSTMVQYALASNPGVSCAGTMKFPDVRQFDERVYASDSGSGTQVQLGSPTSLLGNGTIVQ